MKHSTLYLRLGLLAAAFLLVMAVFSLELLNLQVARGAEFLSQTQEEAALTTRTVVVPALRGSIYDRCGRPLTVSTTGYAVRLDYGTWDKTVQNAVLAEVYEILAAQGYQYTGNLPVSGSPPAYTRENQTKWDALQTFIRARNWPEDMDAPALLARLRERYQIGEEYDDSRALTVAGLRYDMEQASFSPLNPFTVLNDADTATIAALSARFDALPGVRIVTQAARAYATDSAAHILGRVGPIHAEDIADYLALGYARDAIVGTSGLEKALEQELKGSDGLITQAWTADGRLAAEEVTVPVRPGADCYLTLDLALQAATENALAFHIPRIRAEGAARPDQAGADAAGGAAVVIRVGTGEILALASYPTFSLQTFSKDYASLLADPLTPMFNRAIGGTYAPGSVFKMVTAAAALQEGAITTETVIRDEGVYRYYAPDYVYRCWIYRDYGMTHGDLDVTGALQNSCNYFFYETGRLLGIEKLNLYANLFGLGQRTGVELPGESAGVLAGPETRRAAGRAWYAGDTLQAAIGQSDNLFTPLQLANYIAALAGGGVRREAHLVSRVLSGTEVLRQNTPAAADIGLTGENLDAVLEGMLRVTEDGTASKVFADYPVQVIGKTGSAQVESGTANGIFVLAAPAEDPEIAIAVVVEHGGSGNNVAWIARDILSAYLSSQAQWDGAPTDSLIK